MEERNDICVVGLRLAFFQQKRHVLIRDEEVYLPEGWDTYIRSVRGILLSEIKDKWRDSECYMLHWIYGDREKSRSFRIGCP